MSHDDKRQSSSHNRSRTLEHIRASGQISRVELAQISGLTQASISGIVAQTMADGLVVESGLTTPTRGKRRTLLQLNPSARHAVGIALEYDRIIHLVTDLSGHLVGRLVTSGTGDDDPTRVTRRIAGQLTGFLDSIAVDHASVVGIGLASPGPLDSRDGRLLCHKPTSDWYGFPVGHSLGEESGLPVVLDNDATCAAVGEYWVSSGDPAAVAATVYMADGIGSGILLNGVAFRGSSSNPGELGHLSLDVNGPECPCGARGCLEMYATPAVIVDQALLDRGLVADLGLDERHPSRTSFAKIGRAATRGHRASYDLIAHSASYLASAIVALSNILDLDEVTLCGPAFDTAGAIYGRIVQDRLRQQSLMRAIHPVDVQVSQTGADSAALGAAALVLQEAITPHAVTR